MTCFRRVARADTRPRVRTFTPPEASIKRYLTPAGSASRLALASRAIILSTYSYHTLD